MSTRGAPMALSAAAPASSSVVAPSTGVSPPPSIAQRCHTDALHCILAFLSLSDAIRALQCCRDWLRAGLRERPRSASLVVGDMSSLNYICASRMAARHVDRVTMVGGCAADPRAVRRLGAALPRLRELTWTLNLFAAAPREAQGVTFPPSLTRLRLVLPPKVAAQAAQRALGAVAGMSSLASLSLSVETLMSVDGKFAMLNLAPLTLLSSLTHLTLPLLDSTPSHMRHLRRLSLLRSLTVQRQGPGHSINPFVALLAPGHSFTQLERISASLSKAELRVLATIPTLRVLLPHHIHPLALPLLPKRIDTLQICDARFDSVLLDSMQESLLAMRPLTALRLELPYIPPTFLSGVVGRRLRLLSLTGGRLVDLSVFTRTPNLEALSLSVSLFVGSDGVTLPRVVLEFVQEMLSLLPLLRRLAMFNCFGADAREALEQLLPQRLALLRPSCTLQFSECEFGPEPSAE